MYAGQPGTPLGRYRLLALLGQGGMADVFLACTEGPYAFQKLLVVKLARFTGDRVLATMFLEEARIAAQLEHPNIVQTYEIAEQGSRRYIVMEYLDGGSLALLRHRSRKIGGIPLRISLTILSHVLEGLAHAHEARALDGRSLEVIHRDLSPGNIMVTAQGVVKIVDFGIAKAAGSGGFTHTGRLSGKLGYMSPEQLRGEPADVRDDLFSFGAILAEAALDEKLWGDASDHEIAMRLGDRQIPVLDRGTPIDPALRAICQRALAPERAQRHPSAGHLKADLASCLAALGGAVSQNELAQFVRAAVAADRARLHAIIDAQLQKIASQHWDATPTLSELPRITYTPSQPRPHDAVIEPGLAVSDRPHTPSIAATPGSRPASSRALSIRVVAFCVTLFVSVGGLVAVQPRGSSSPRTIPRSTGPTITPSQPRRPASAAPAIAETPAETPAIAETPAAARASVIDIAPVVQRAPQRTLQTTAKRVAAPPKDRASGETAPASQPGPASGSSSSAATPSKRPLDANVLDDDPPNPTIDRNPW